MGALRITHRLIDQLFDPPCVPSRTVRDVKGSNVIGAGFEHTIRAVVLQVAFVCLLAMVSPEELRSIANLSTLIEVRFAGTRII